MRPRTHLTTAALGLATAIGLPAAAGPFVASQPGDDTPGYVVVGAETHGHTAAHYVLHPSHSEDVVSVQRADPDKIYEITILFFYTPQFADDFRDRAHMEEEIEKSVELLNLSLENSHVNATFRIVGIERHPAMPTRQFDAHDWIVNDRRAKSRRDELGADIVYALVDDPTGVAGAACQPGSFTSSTGESCFVGSVNNWTPSVRTFDNENIWQTILRHEVGHNLGIQHSPEFGGNPSGGFYPGAVGYTVTSHEPWFGTVMGGNELPRFSTSSERFDFREHKNLVVGRRGVHEASTALLHSIGPVSNYRPPAPTLDPEPPPVDDAPCDAAGEGVNLLGHHVFMCIVANGEVHQLPAEKLSDKVAVFGRRSDPKAMVKLVGGCTWGAIAAVTTARKSQIRVYNTANGNEWEHNHNRSGLAPSGYSGNALCDEAGN